MSTVVFRQIMVRAMFRRWAYDDWREFVHAKG